MIKYELTSSRKHKKESPLLLEHNAGEVKVPVSADRLGCSGVVTPGTVAEFSITAHCVALAMTGASVSRSLESCLGQQSVACPDRNS